MQIVAVRPSAEIVPLAAHRPMPNRLTMRDRIHAIEWEAANAAPSGARLEIHDRQPDDGPEVGDYVAIYRAAERWAVWGAARDGALVTIWHAFNGLDVGAFTSMKDALAAVSFDSIQPRARR